MPAPFVAAVSAGSSLFGAVSRSSSQGAALSLAEKKQKLEQELKQQQLEYQKELNTTQNYQDYYLKMNMANRQFNQNLAELNKPNYWPVVAISAVTIIAVVFILRPKSD